MACGVIAARSAIVVGLAPSRSMLMNTAACAARMSWPAATTPSRIRRLRCSVACESRYVVFVAGSRRFRRLGGDKCSGPLNSCSSYLNNRVPEELVMMSDTATIERAEAVRRHMEATGIDDDAAHAIYHDDAVLEFPQSGERFEGVANFRAWREQYPGKVRIDVREIRGCGDLWVAECGVSYDGG